METKCQEGCVCPEGTVLHGQRCINSSQCFCHRGGHSYRLGQEIKEDCNTWYVLKVTQTTHNTIVVCGLHWMATAKTDRMIGALNCEDATIYWPDIRGVSRNSLETETLRQPRIGAITNRKEQWPRTVNAIVQCSWVPQHMTEEDTVLNNHETIDLFSLSI